MATNKTKTVKQTTMTADEVEEACRLWLAKKYEYPPRDVAPDLSRSGAAWCWVEEVTNAKTY